jgi:hypothetical protein
MPPHWQGVFPAVTTQLHKDESLDLDASARHIEVLIESGISGLIMGGSLGENQVFDPAEKRQVVRGRGARICPLPFGEIVRTEKAGRRLTPSRIVFARPKEHGFGFERRVLDRVVGDLFPKPAHLTPHDLLDV